MTHRPMVRALAGVAVAMMFGTAQAEPVTVDNCGTPLTFDTMPERMVVHDINMSEMAFALGLQDRMVGVTGITGWYKTTPEFDEARGSIPELAPKYPTIENLVAATPDLYFAGWYYGMRPGGDVTPETLAPHGIKTLILTESCVHLDKSRPAASLELLFTDVERLGKIFGKEAEAAVLVAGWKARVTEIKATVGDVSGTRVFLYDSGEDKPFTAGKFAMPTAMIEALGATNITGGMDTSWGTTSWEAVAAADPGFLILLDYQSGGGATDLLEFLQSHPVIKHTTAVRNKAYVALRYEELTPGPANIEAMARMAKAMKDAMN
ncbi:MAG: ABC transporter substrate-binding protein [Alphaproteobacteria bacterium]|nr:ABC transporter substrate-binding protein [Alphaproteobacteria bacterium]